jgi:multicomponent Na+:H+ antiporter subunit B
MSRRFRLGLFAVSAVVLGVVLVHGLAGLPRFGDYHGVYGTVLNRVTVSERHATDVITAINFDFRGLDTMGEEFILFAASIGLVVLLREQRDEHVDPERAAEAGDPEQSGGHRLHTSPALLATGRWVVLAAAVILVFVAGGRVAMAPIRPTGAAEALEAIGAGGYVVIGIAGLIAGMRFLSNFLPLGTVGSLLSSGTITSLSTIVGLEVAGALTLIVSEFVDQRLLVDDDRPTNEPRSS